MKIQIEVFIYRITTKREIEFLLMKRVPEKGGFWQPLTGGVKAGESHNEAIMREVQEENGIKNIRRVIDTEYHFSFNDHGQSYVEFVYGAEVSLTETITLSHEHDEYRWVDKNTAITLLKWPNNKRGLIILCEKLSSR